MWTAGRKFDVQEPRLPQPHSGVSAKELYIGLTYSGAGIQEHGLQSELIR